jgi:hypothetical protein
MVTRLRDEGVVPAARRMRRPPHANASANFANGDDEAGQNVVRALVAALKKGDAASPASCQACRTLIGEVAAVAAQVSVLTERAAMTERTIIELGRALHPRHAPGDDPTFALRVTAEQRRLGLAR